jgi:lipopolysaccharide biosynthesis glycosyltransferase
MPEKRFSSEQHLFNTLYKDSYKKVDVRFNFLSSWHAHTLELSKASIIHYSGPVKPWHLPRRHAPAWTAVNASWQSWFDAEKRLKSFVSKSPLAAPLESAAWQALFSGRLHTGKGALAGLFLKALSVLGPLGHPLVALLIRRVRR